MACARVARAVVESWPVRYWELQRAGEDQTFTIRSTLWQLLPTVRVNSSPRGSLLQTTVRFKSRGLRPCREPSRARYARGSTIVVCARPFGSRDDSGACAQYNVPLRGRLPPDTFLP